MSGEPTLDMVRAAVLALPRADLEAIAVGPTPDPEDCRICEHFDDEVFGHGSRPAAEHDAILTLIDWHRFYGSPAHDGRGPVANARCETIYQLAREALEVKA